MKKFILIFLLTFMFINVNADSVNQIDGKYYVSINNELIRMKRLSYNGFDYFKVYNNNDNIITSSNNVTIDKIKFDNINSYIENVYTINKSDDFYYYLVQAMIFKEVYGIDNVFWSTSANSPVMVFENMIDDLIINNEVTEIKDISDGEINVNDNYVFDNNFIYLDNNFDNTKSGIYNIKYIKENYDYLLSNTNYFISENTKTIGRGSFNIKVIDNKPVTLKQNVTNLVNNNLDEDLEKNEETNIVKVTNNNDELSNTSINNQDNMEIISNPKTIDNILLYAIICVSISLIYMILYIKYRKSC